MFPIAQKDYIPRFEFETQGYGIDGMGRVQCEDDLFIRARIDEFCDRASRSLDLPLGISFDAVVYLFGKPVMTSPAAAGGIVRIIFVDGCDDLPGDQRRAGVVQIYGRLAAAPPFQ